MTKATLLLASAASFSLAACATAQGGAPMASSKAEQALSADPDISAEAPAADSAPEIGSFGFDEAGMDRSVAPGDDFYSYANGDWQSTTEIPSDKSNYGMFTALADLSQERLRTLLDVERNDTASKVGNAYASYLDEDRVESLGLAPAESWLTRIRGVTGKDQLPALVYEAARSGIPSLFGIYVDQDDRNPDRYLLQISQSGLGLPDRDYYLEDSERFTTVRAAYVAHVQHMLELAGENNGASRAQALYDFEAKLAEAHWNREDRSDAVKTYNRMTLAELDRRTPGFNFTQLVGMIDSDVEAVNVRTPSAIEGTARLIAETDLQTLTDLVMLRSLDTLGDVLPDAIAQEAFAFNGTVLSGTPEREPRWKRAVNFTEAAMGEEVGHAYVDRYFPPESKAAMEGLVDNVLAAMGRRINALEWMQPATKQRAEVKLANFTVKIGYPDRWKDYGGLDIRRDDLFGNAIRASQFAFDDEVSKLGEPIRRWEWGMYPQTVNAYANFGMTEVVFPAAILQPPFFDPQADPAINYGGIAAVIGHEISHHFDDQGSKYNEQGALADWWTPEDVAAFDAAGQALIAQYDAYEPLPGEHVKGEFTLGENIGDLAGLTVALDAYHETLGGREARVIDGLTGDQRFFLGWAQVWRRLYRQENLSQRLLTDPHAPSQQRASVVRNLDAWYDAFDVTPGDELYLAPEDRVHIW